MMKLTNIVLFISCLLKNKASIGVIEAYYIDSFR